MQQQLWLDWQACATLAPEQRRPVPVFTTSSDGGHERGESWGLERSLAQRITAVTLRVPALRDRGPLSLRSAVQSRLGGHAIRTEALRALERRPWWGNEPELASALDALRANVRGPIDLTALRQHLPHLVSAGGQPIRVLMHPVVQSSGAVTGLQEEFHDGAVMVGRIRTPAELDGVLAAGARGEAISALLGGVRPAFLCLSHLTRLSRATALIHHGDLGLRVTLLPGVRLSTSAGPLSPDGAALRELRAGEGVNVGSAGEVLVKGPDGAVILHLFLFAGAVAFEEHGRLAAERASRALAPAGQTVQGETQMAPPPEAPRIVERPRLPLPPAAPAIAPPLPPPPAPVAHEPRRVGLWVLEPEEVEILVEVVLRYPGGDFAAHVERSLTPLSARPDVSRLAGFVLGVRPTQYCSRLFEYQANEALRVALLRALAERPDGASRLGRLPTGIQRALAGG